MSLGKKFLIFIIPLILFFIFPVAVLWYSGEFLSTADAVKNISDKKQLILLGWAYKDVTQDLILKTIFVKNPEVLILGSSRVLEFRSDFFKSGVAVYNGGLSVKNAKDYKKILDNIPIEKTPRVIIVGLDLDFFHESQDIEAMNSNKTQQNSDLNSKFNSLIVLLRNVYIGYFNGKFSLTDLFFPKVDQLDRIGLKAISADSGMRNDGSYHYGKIINNLINLHPEKNPDYLFADTLYRIDNGNKNFKYGQTISPDAFKEFQNFLQAAKNRQIEVIGFFPPYAPTVYSKLKLMGDKFAFYDVAYKMIGTAFDNYNYKLYNFSDVSNFGFNDRDFIDGFHGSETVYLGLFMKMLETDKILSKYVDLLYLKKAWQHPCSKYEVFCYGF